MADQRKQSWWNSFSLEEDFKKRQLARVLAFTAAYVAISSVCLMVVYMRMLEPITRGELPPELQLELIRAGGGVPGLRDALFLWVSLMLGMSSFFAVVVGLYFSHKLAGPLYRFKLELQRIAAGEELRPVRLRQGDDFQDLALELTRALEQVATTQSDLRGRLEAAMQRLDEVGAALRAELREPGDGRALERVLAKLEQGRSVDE